jgi:hypothetical protein
MASNLSPVEEFTNLQLERLDSYDILELNYCAACRLPGTGKSDLDAWLAKRDEWAARVRFETCRHLYRFNPKSKEPTEFTCGNSLARFFCYFLLQVLQEDCGVRYHPDRKFKPDFCQPQDVFAHGIMDDDGQGGTCASMPVVYVSVGRRLGFPINLIETRGHLFFRWDDPRGTVIRWQNPDLTLWIPPDRFNVEGACEGVAYYPDSHYIQWPELWSQADFDHGCYLRSLTRQEELSSFLIQRAECFHDLGNRLESLKAIYHARKLSPDDPRYQQLHALRTKELDDHEQTMARIAEMDREQQRKRLPGVLGHSPNCRCAQCDRLRLEAQSHPLPPHGPSCQCLHCKQVREAASVPLGTAFSKGIALGQVPPHVLRSGFPHHVIQTKPHRFGLPGH